MAPSAVGGAATAGATVAAGTASFFARSPRTAFARRSAGTDDDALLLDGFLVAPWRGEEAGTFFEAFSLSLAGLDAKRRGSDKAVTVPIG